MSPSQDLLWRAKRAGLRILGKTSPSVIVLWSGQRPGSYLPKFQAEDNEFWLNAITFSPEVVTGEFAAAAIRSDVETKKKRVLSLRGTLARLKRKPYWIRLLTSRMMGPLVEATGRHPESLFTWLQHRQVGGFINHVRAMNNLGPRDFHPAARGSDTL